MQAVFVGFRKTEVSSLTLPIAHSLYTTSPSWPYPFSSQHIGVVEVVKFCWTNYLWCVDVIRSVSLASKFAYQ